MEVPPSKLKGWKTATMKRTLIVILLVALAVITIMPVAASAATTDTKTTSINASVSANSITVTPPAAMSFGILLQSATLPNNKNSTGSVAVVVGSTGSATWTVTAEQKSGVNTLGFMARDASVKLTNPLLVAKTGSPASWNVLSVMAPAPTTPLHGDVVANTLLQWTGTTTSDTLPFYVRQWVEAGDLTNTGSYSLVVTFTGTVT